MNRNALIALEIEVSASFIKIVIKIFKYFKPD